MADLEGSGSSLRCSKSASAIFNDALSLANFDSKTTESKFSSPQIETYKVCNSVHFSLNVSER